MKRRTDPAQRQRKPDDLEAPDDPLPLTGDGGSSVLTAVTGSMALSEAPFVAKSPPQLGSSTPPPPPTPPSTLTRNLRSHKDEVNSAVSSAASSGRTRPTVENSTSGGRGGGGARDETMYLLLGSLQAVIGVVMAVFGVMALVRDAAMASTAAGIWGGAVAVASGTIGVVAGLRSCYSRSGSPSVAPTAFMASSLVAIATANLVLVLTAIGLARDFRDLRSDQMLPEPDDEEDEAWRGVVASCGLVLASALQLLVTIASAYRCYRVVCPCASRRRSRHEPLYNQSCTGSPDSLRSTLKSNTKERLVSHWLTGSSDAPSAAAIPAGVSPLFPGSPTPSGLLLFSTQPPPPGHHPQTIYTLPPPPPPPPSTPPSLLHRGAIMAQYPMLIHPRPRPRAVRSSTGALLLPPSRNYSPLSPNRRRPHHPHGHGNGSKEARHRHRGRSKASPGSADRSVNTRAAAAVTSQLTAEQVAKTYTGLDRKMAEDFLAVLDHGRQRASSNLGSSSNPTAPSPTSSSPKTVPAHVPGPMTPDDF